MRAEKLQTKIRQEQIAEAALRLVAAEGMEALSVAKIARHVGVVPSALYRHFRSKDEVLDAVLELIGAKMMANAQAVLTETGDPLEQLRRLLMRHIELIRQNQAIPRIIFSEDIFGGNRRRKARTYAMVQRFLGEIARIVDHSLNVSSNSTPRIQEVHITVGHVICEMIDFRLFQRPDMK